MVRDQVCEEIGRDFKVDTISKNIRDEITVRLPNLKKDVVDSNTENYNITMQESQPYTNEMDLFIVTWNDVVEKGANALKDTAGVAEAHA